MAVKRSSSGKGILKESRTTFSGSLAPNETEALKKAMERASQASTLEHILADYERAAKATLGQCSRDEPRARDAVAVLDDLDNLKHFIKLNDLSASKRSKTAKHVPDYTREVARIAISLARNGARLAYRSERESGGGKGGKDRTAKQHACELAKNFWTEYPDARQDDAAQHIAQQLEKSGHGRYRVDTIRDWTKHLAPQRARKSGRPRKAPA